MKDELVGFEVAKLAKEKGFTCFTKNTKSTSINNRNFQDSLI
jgi:hypothetical protein